MQLPLHLRAARARVGRGEGWMPSTPTAERLARRWLARGRPVWAPKGAARTCIDIPLPNRRTSHPAPVRWNLKHETPSAGRASPNQPIDRSTHQPISTQQFPFSVIIIPCPMMPCQPDARSVSPAFPTARAERPNLTRKRWRRFCAPSQTLSTQPITPICWSAYPRRMTPPSGASTTHAP